jgi:hypothetical protein
MTDQEFMQQTRERLELLRDEQRRLHERLATEMRRMHSLRQALGIFAGALALGLGMSIGYDLGRR